MEDLLARARQCLQHAAHIAVLSGAGISAESGVPTFRDAQTGLWARFRPEELATEDAFRRHPERVWDWYAERRASLAAVQPNAGHLALAEFERRHPGRLTVITQNVDGLHQRAGSQGVLALHGSLAEDRWLDPCALHRQRACDVARAEPGRPPRCPQWACSTCCATTASPVASSGSRSTARPAMRRSSRSCSSTRRCTT